MGNQQDRFTQCWQRDAPRVLAFAQRHVGISDAPDVVSETFLVAWRRWADVPDPAIAWLMVTARQVMHNSNRSVRRQRALADRIGLLDGVAVTASDSATHALERREALERLARLDEQHREALLLIGWDGLTSDQAAVVLGIRPAAFRRRVSRARAALTADSAESSVHSVERALPRLITSKDLP